MALAVVTVAAGGMPVVWTSAPGALPVTEVTNKFGLAVTQVTGKPGMPVTYVAADGTIVSPFTPTMFNASDKLQINLTNGNLTATGTGAGGVRAVKGLSSGKYYFEATMTTWTQSFTGIGIGLASAALAAAVGGTGSAGIVRTSGNITVDAGYILSMGVRASGEIIGIATDLTAKLIWIRVSPAGNYNNSGTANPATGAGGINIAAISTGLLYPFYTANAASEGATLNFGGSAFTGAVPSGFTAGWG